MIITPPNEPLKAPSNADNDATRELKRVTEIMENLSAKLLDKEKVERELIEKRERKLQLDEMHSQEKLRLEQELCQFKVYIIINLGNNASGI